MLTLFKKKSKVKSLVNDSNAWKEGDLESAIVNQEHQGREARQASKPRQARGKTSEGEAPKPKPQNSLHRAAAWGNVKALLKALEYENIDQRNEDGVTPLHLAAATGHLEILRVLLGKGASVYTTDNDGCTPLHFAAGVGLVPCIDLLLKSNSPMQNRNMYHETALDVAWRAGSVEAAMFLESRGAQTGVVGEEDEEDEEEEAATPKQAKNFVDGLKEELTQAENARKAAVEEKIQAKKQVEEQERQQKMLLAEQQEKSELQEMQEQIKKNHESEIQERRAEQERRAKEESEKIAKQLQEVQRLEDERKSRLAKGENERESDTAYTPSFGGSRSTSARRSTNQASAGVNEAKGNRIQSSNANPSSILPFSIKVDDIEQEEQVKKKQEAAAALEEQKYWEDLRSKEDALRTETRLPKQRQDSKPRKQQWIGEEERVEKAHLFCDDEETQLDRVGQGAPSSSGEAALAPGRRQQHRSFQAKNESDARPTSRSPGRQAKEQIPPEQGGTPPVAIQTVQGSKTLHDTPVNRVAARGRRSQVVPPEVSVDCEDETHQEQYVPSAVHRSDSGNARARDGIPMARRPVSAGRRRPKLENQPAPQASTRVKGELEPQDKSAVEQQHFLRRAAEEQEEEEEVFSVVESDDYAEGALEERGIQRDARRLLRDKMAAVGASPQESLSPRRNFEEDEEAGAELEHVNEDEDAHQRAQLAEEEAETEAYRRAQLLEEEAREEAEQRAQLEEEEAREEAAAERQRSENEALQMARDLRRQIEAEEEERRQKQAEREEEARQEREEELRALREEEERVLQEEEARREIEEEERRERERHEVERQRRAREEQQRVEEAILREASEREEMAKEQEMLWQAQERNRQAELAREEEKEQQLEEERERQKEELRRNMWEEQRRQAELAQELEDRQWQEEQERRKQEREARRLEREARRQEEQNERQAEEARWQAEQAARREARKEARRQEELRAEQEEAELEAQHAAEAAARHATSGAHGTGLPEAVDLSGIDSPVSPLPPSLREGTVASSGSLGEVYTPAEPPLQASANEEAAMAVHTFGRKKLSVAVPQSPPGPVADSRPLSAAGQQSMISEDAATPPRRAPEAGMAGANHLLRDMDAKHVAASHVTESLSEMTYTGSPYTTFSSYPLTSSPTPSTPYTPIPCTPTTPALHQPPLPLPQEPPRTPKEQLMAQLQRQAREAAEAQQQALEALAAMQDPSQAGEVCVNKAARGTGTSGGGEEQYPSVQKWDGPSQLSVEPAPSSLNGIPKSATTPRHVLASPGLRSAPVQDHHRSPHTLAPGTLMDACAVSQGQPQMAPQVAAVKEPALSTSTMEMNGSNDPRARALRRQQERREAQLQQQREYQEFVDKQRLQHQQPPIGVGGPPLSGSDGQPNGASLWPGVPRSPPPDTAAISMEEPSTPARVMSASAAASAAPVTPLQRSMDALMDFQRSLGTPRSGSAPTTPAARQPSGRHPAPFSATSQETAGQFTQQRASAGMDIYGMEQMAPRHTTVSSAQDHAQGNTRPDKGLAMCPGCQQMMLPTELWEHDKATNCLMKNMINRKR
ncbi:hypothetical protein CYMTET_51096 [Cymbomonas tetramitiformis]|uniref:Uncharacterized protein n=1 Tax=Cymbomonas tetramitiformis TaxID=36881 RepID=A0AAE0BNH1_9CHLO|nr:hypothetical protein CYMTET_51096 [Cymbomonas tetramitiformis]